MKWLDMFSDSERRMAPRQVHPRILVYYWDGSTPTTHELRDISAVGAFVRTSERWYIGTLVRLTLVLQREPAPTPGEPPEEDSVSMFAKAVRHAEDGVGVEFVAPHPRERTQLREFLARISALAPRAHAAGASQSGQALVEFALILPLILLFIVNAFNFGGFLYDWITVANAARAGVQYQVLGGASVGFPRTPSYSDVVAVVTKDVSSLPNKASLQVTVCKTNNDVSGYTCNGPTVTPAPPPDPEKPYFVQATVDVSYTYKPFISLWSFNALGIHATLPPTTVHRRATMRIIQ